MISSSTSKVREPSVPHHTHTLAWIKPLDNVTTTTNFYTHILNTNAKKPPKLFSAQTQRFQHTLAVHRRNIYRIASLAVASLTAPTGLLCQSSHQPSKWHSERSIWYACLILAMSFSCPSSLKNLAPLPLFTINMSSKLPVRTLKFPSSPECPAELPP